MSQLALFDRRTAIGVLAGLVALRAEPLPAQEQQIESTGSPSEKVFLIYDEQGIRDKDRAQIYALLSHSVPVESWPKVKAHRRQRLPRIAQKFFEVFAKVDPKTKKSYPKTTQTIRASGWVGTIQTDRDGLFRIS